MMKEEFITYPIPKLLYAPGTSKVVHLSTQATSSSGHIKNVPYQSECSHICSGWPAEPVPLPGQSPHRRFLIEKIPEGVPVCRLCSPSVDRRIREFFSLKKDLLKQAMLNQGFISENMWDVQFRYAGLPGSCKVLLSRDNRQVQFFLEVVDYDRWDWKNGDTRLDYWMAVQVVKHAKGVSASEWEGSARFTEETLQELFES